MIAALNDASPEVRYWSANALSMSKSKKALPELERLAATDHVELSPWGRVSEAAMASIIDIKRSRKIALNDAEKTYWKRAALQEDSTPDFPMIV